MHILATKLGRQVLKHRITELIVMGTCGAST